MPIPELNEHGLLPPGIHSCTIDEIKTRFGSFQGNDRRVGLFAKLVELISAMCRSGMFQALVIDGSFVTRKAAPNDIDVLAVLRPHHDFERDLPVSEYALVSRALLRRRFGFDVVVAEEMSAVYLSYVEFFSRMREDPQLRKGLLRIEL
jgi:hypothetical protein